METIIYEVKDRIGYITLNRPQKLNSIDATMRDELFEVFTDVKLNPDVWVAIITGAGDRAFSTGHDLVSHEESRAANKTRGADTDQLYTFIHTIWKPVIAAINGYCLAQGGGLALCSDIRIAVPEAEFGWPQVKRGISSTSGPTLLAHKIPLGIALEMLFTGRFITSEMALKWGLINKVVPRAQLMAAAEEMAQEILANAPLAIRTIKEVAVTTQGKPLSERVKYSALVGAGIRGSEDSKEGLRAFAEKRTPVFVGR